MNERTFINKYLECYRKSIFEGDIVSQLIAMKDVLIKANKKGKKIIFVGNGASAAIASHCALDFTKQGKIRSVCFNEAALLTAFGNDYGYEHWVENALKCWADKGDVVVLISSSGKSPNLVNAAKYARQKGFPVITFSGFSKKNPLKSLGNINFWVNNSSYNIVECTHMIWLMLVCDLIIGKMEYAVS